MRALFIKEFRQGRPLLLFAAALGVLLAVGHWVFGRTVYYRFHAGDLHGAVGWLAISAIVALASFAGAGLFAGETSSGTLPHLLALPLSRRRIWLTKMAAGLALAAAGAAVLLLIDALLIPQAVVRSLPLRAYVWDLICWSLLSFAAAAFASALVSSTTGALGLSIVLGGVIAGGAAYAVLGRGGPLLGYADDLDVALWCLLLVPVLLTVSAWVVQRGELLHTRRRWWQGAALLVIGGTSMALLTIGASRAATRYRPARVVRTRVARSDQYQQTPLLAVEALTSPIAFGRAPQKGWLLRDSEWGASSYDLARAAAYRGDYLVVLRSDRGQEVGHWRTMEYASDCETTWSQDGRYLAVLRGSDGLTWGRQALSNEETLLLLDTKTGRTLYSGWPRGLRRTEDASSEIALSPSGRYLFLSVWDGKLGYISFLDVHGRLLGTPPGQLWGGIWSPTEEAVFGTDQQQLLRIGPADGTARLLWQSDGGPRTRASLRGFSPDGRWLLVDEDFLRTSKDDSEVEKTVLWAVRADGAVSRRLVTAAVGSGSGYSAVWTGDSRALYLVVWSGQSGSRRMLRWMPDAAAPEAVPAIGPIGRGALSRTFPRPGTDQAVLWLTARHHRTADLPEADRALLVDSQGQVRPSPAGRLAEDYRLVAFDPKGRALLSEYDGRSILSVDLDTGKAKRIYP